MKKRPRSSFPPARWLVVTRALVVFLCVGFATSAALAQSFTVPGNQRGWFNTGLDLPAGTLVRLSATGQVDVGSGWGIHGPEGTTRFADVPGYPAATRLRYGLVARLTESRTDAHDELHTDYAYGETREFCSGHGGHLWLAINDDRPENNGGGYIVTLTRGKCAATVAAAPAPLSGRFRVRLNGFSAHAQSWDDALNSDGWGDEVYFVWNIDTIDLTGRNDTLRTANYGSFTSVFGDTGAGAIIRAGTASGTGGLATGNSFPAADPWAGGSRETGPAIYNADLIQGRTAGVIIPAIFESDRASSLRETYNVAVRNARPLIQSSLAALLRGSALRTASQFLVRGESVGLGGLAATLSHGASFTGERVDRPIGMRPPPGGSNFTFVPQALVLTYESAELIARSDLFGRGRGVVEIRYTDDPRLRGDYSLYLLVERVP
jgi:hypothetical protein